MMRKRVSLEELEEAKLRYKSKARIAWIMFISIIMVTLIYWIVERNPMCLLLMFAEIVPYIYLENAVYRLDVHNKSNLTNINKAFDELRKTDKVYSFNDGERIKAYIRKGTLKDIDSGQPISWILTDILMVVFFDEFVVYMDKHNKEIIYYEDIKINLYGKTIAENEYRPRDSRFIGYKEIDGKRIDVLLYGLMEINIADKYNIELLVSSIGKLKEFYRHMKLVDRLHITDNSYLQYYEEGRENAG